MWKGMTINSAFCILEIFDSEVKRLRIFQIATNDLGESSVQVFLLFVAATSIKCQGYTDGVVDSTYEKH